MSQGRPRFAQKPSTWARSLSGSPFTPETPFALGHRPACRVRAISADAPTYRGGAEVAAVGLLAVGEARSSGVQAVGSSSATVAAMAVGPRRTYPARGDRSAIGYSSRVEPFAQPSHLSPTSTCGT